ncbi:MAG: glycoside hydrolase family 2 TIM barrel-domain containing protein [Bacteroidales bacterium]|nr:glycoside hydrolase family 2 TIM barrel-domain containing protein [Bacteroidales bacterium]
MKKSLLFALLVLTAVVCHAQSRTSELWNFGWKFHAGDVQGAESRDFDDSAWRDVDLPHDFQIEQPWVAPSADERADTSDPGANRKSRLSARGFKEMGAGWYRKTFTPADSLRGRRILLDFEGIMLVGDVYLNGERVGGTDYGYLGFEIDVTKRLKFGEKNVVAVRADTQKEINSRWYTGGGLYRDVHFVTTDARQYFTRHPLQILTSITRPSPIPSQGRSVDTNLSDNSNNTLPLGRDGEGSALVTIQAECTVPFDSKTKNLDIRVRILDRQGNVVKDVQCRPVYRARQKTNEYLLDSLTIQQPHLWSCADPYLYTAEVSLLRPDGSVADVVKERFGIRTVEFSPEFGLKLNGRKVLLKGIANHHTLGALGAAAYPRAIEKRIQLLKEFGFNHIRTSHNPYSESLLDLCDEYGILVVDELYDKWLRQYCGGRRSWEELWQHDVPEWIRRDRNHPSVIVWSLGNELQTYWEQAYADWGVTPYRLQRELLRRYDPTRPVTVAMHPRGRSLDTDSLPAPLVFETDIAAYNYRYMYFPGDGRRFPNMIFYQSEANNAMMGPNWYEMDLNKVLGLAYWGMIDYLGESQGWPTKGWNLGAFDISLEPKPTAWFLRSYFNEDDPMVHIGVFQTAKTEDWNGERQGGARLTHSLPHTAQTLTLHTYTNCDEVELLVNGQSVGTRQNDRKNPKVRNKIVWTDVTYTEGSVVAIGRKQGREVARHELLPTGQAVALRLESDNDDWRADGLDLQHIRVWAVDKKGRRVYAATNEVQFSVTGPARLIAVSSGDHDSDELNVTDHRRLYDGSALCILRSSRERGNVVLTATADGLKSATLKMKTK